MRTLWSVPVWGATMIDAGGGDDLSSRRGPDPAPSSSGGSAPSKHPQPPRPPFVLEAQRALRDLGYHPGPIDGMFGPHTRMALEKYQLAEKLPVTGQLDAETIDRLDVYRRLFRPIRER